MNWYLFWKLLHIVGVLGFLASHGASAAVALRLRKEREAERVRALLDLSASTRIWMHSSLLVLLVGGVADAFIQPWWSAGWLWASMVLLVVLLVLAFPLAVPYYKRVRAAVSSEGPGMPQEELVALLRSRRPIVIAVVETVGILIIAWLMIWKPF